jgi:prepilin-type processing-associated H-X9-DG protein
MGQVDGIANRCSFLMNSLLSHKTRRYGRWSLLRFIDEMGTSNFICFSERNAAAFDPSTGGDPRQDDYDVWLGTNTIQPWIAYARHTQAANNLYLDGHAETLSWDREVPDMYPSASEGETSLAGASGLCPKFGHHSWASATQRLLLNQVAMPIPARIRPQMKNTWPGKPPTRSM